MNSFIFSLEAFFHERGSNRISHFTTSCTLPAMLRNASRAGLRALTTLSDAEGERPKVAGERLTTSLCSGTDYSINKKSEEKGKTVGGDG
jgi:hypothetical protein